MEGRKVTITLEVHVDGDEVQGSARDGDGLGQQFTGWIGLVTAIDALLAPAPVDAA